MAPKSEESTVRNLSVEVQQSLSEPHPPSSPRFKVTIDYLSYPHIFESVLSHASLEVLVALRGTCRTLRTRLIETSGYTEITTNCKDNWDKSCTGIVQCSAREDLSHVSYDDWSTPPMTLSARSERMALALACKTARIVDLCGTVPDVLVKLASEAEVIRTRVDHDGLYHSANLDLTDCRPRKVVVFPATHKHYHTHQEPISQVVKLPTTITRLVFPLGLYREIDATTAGVMSAPIYPVQLRNFDVTSTPTVSNPQCDLVIVCPQIITMTPVGWNRTMTMDDACSAAKNLQVQIMGLVTSGIVWGVRTVKIVNIEAVLKPARLVLRAQHDPNVNGNDLLGETPDTEEVAMLLPEFMFYVAGFACEKIQQFRNAYHLRIPHLFRSFSQIPTHDEVLDKLQLLSLADYRSSLGPGEWEIETKEELAGRE